MLNDKQQQWVCNKCLYLKKYLDSNWPLTEEQWEYVVNYIGDRINDSGKYSNEVMHLFFKFIEPYDRRANDEMRRL